MGVRDNTFSFYKVVVKVVPNLYTRVLLNPNKDNKVTLIVISGKNKSFIEEKGCHTMYQCKLSLISMYFVFD